MAGVIEDENPEGGRISYLAVVANAPRSEPNSIASSRFDVPALLDQLAYMELPQTLIHEAAARLRVDPVEGKEWLTQRLKELETPDQGPTCAHCGSVLLDVAWRGVATVRCDQCGGRWGLEVTDDSVGQWAINGPSAEWLEAHPLEDEDNRYPEYPPEVILEAGMPPLPEGIDVGTSFPVASWQDGRWGAVLYVLRHDPVRHDWSGRHYEAAIEVLERRTGSWILIDSDRDDWINPFSPPPDLLRKWGVLFAGRWTNRDVEPELSLVGGICRSDVCFVEVVDAKSTTRYSVAPGPRMFVVGGYGPNVVVRLLDASGAVALASDERTLQFPVGPSQAAF
jgi:hypothetical protein